MSSSADQSMALDGASFRAIAELAYQESGLTLVEEKSSMIQSRLRHRLRDLGLTTFAAYCDLVNSQAGLSERRHLISALTTNVSHFFREDHHFDTLREVLSRKLPSLRQGSEMRVWSAGCSNGQEALSAAMTLVEQEPDIEKLNVRILATDIDPEVVAFARQGCYPERLMGGVPDVLVKKYFDLMAEERGEPVFRAKQKLQNLIKVNELNLLSDWPMRKSFDVIFCRNVVIYFDLKTQTALWPRFHKALDPEGVLFLGHSERIADPNSFGFDCTGPTTYHRRSN